MLNGLWGSQHLSKSLLLAQITMRNRINFSVMFVKLFFLYTDQTQLYVTLPNASDGISSHFFLVFTHNHCVLMSRALFHKWDNSAAHLLQHDCFSLNSSAKRMKNTLRFRNEG